MLPGRAGGVLMSAPDRVWVVVVSDGGVGSAHLREEFAVADAEWSEQSNPRTAFDVHEYRLHRPVPWRTGEPDQQAEPVAWVTNESLQRLQAGGNSKGAVPIHRSPSATATTPLYLHPTPAAVQRMIEAAGGVLLSAAAKDWTLGKPAAVSSTALDALMSALKEVQR